MEQQTDSPAAEPLAYVGTAVVLFFGAIGVAATWDEMSALTQVLVLGAAALVLAVVSLVTPTSPVAAGRVADTAASTAAVLVGWAAGLFAHANDVQPEGALAIGAGVGGVVAAVAYLRRRGALPHVVAGAGLVGAVAWLMLALDAPEPAVSVVILGLGLLWWATGLGPYLHPTRAAAIGGAFHVFAGAASTLAYEDAWPLLAVIAAGLALAYASSLEYEPVVNRSFASAIGIVAAAKLGLLIDDPVLRIVVAGVAVGVAMVTAGAMLVRRRSSQSEERGVPTGEES